MSLLFVLLASLFSVSQCIDNGGIVQVNTNNLRTIDQDGRERIFHGMNVVFKGTPYHPIVDHFDFQYSFCEQDAILLKKWGMNAIRLGVMWPGVEPIRGQYNETYLSIMQQIVDTASKYGIYSLIDMHQDVTSEKYCGEGLPTWAVQPSDDERIAQFPEPLAAPYAVDNQTGFPSPADCNRIGWADYQFTFEVGSAVQNLYKNKDGLLDSWANYWGKLASVWKGNTWILGYELINEPWAGDIFEDPLLMVPGVADYVNLAPVYEVLHTAIRKQDTDHIVFFEGVTWDDFLIGFKQNPGGEEYRNRSVLAYHIYVPPEISIPLAFKTRMSETKRLGCAAFCTETDSWDASDMADEYIQSWLHWEYKPFIPITGFNYGFWNSDGSFNTDAIKRASRAYAQATAGEIQSMSFDQNSRIFKLVFKVKASCKLPTEIYLNEEVHYPSGFQVSFDPEGVAKWSQPETNLIYVYTSANDGDQVTVTISPK